MLGAMLLGRVLLLPPELCKVVLCQRRKVKGGCGSCAGPQS